MLVLEMQEHVSDALPALLKRVDKLKDQSSLCLVRHVTSQWQDKSSTREDKITHGPSENWNGLSNQSACYRTQERRLRSPQQLQKS